MGLWASRRGDHRTTPAGAVWSGARGCSRSRAGNVTVFQYVATLRLAGHPADRADRRPRAAYGDEGHGSTSRRGVAGLRTATAHLDDTPSLQGRGPGGRCRQPGNIGRAGVRACRQLAARPVGAGGAAGSRRGHGVGRSTRGRADSRATTFIEAPPAAVAAVSGGTAAGGSAAEVVVQWQQASPTRIVLRVDAPGCRLAGARRCVLSGLGSPPGRPAHAALPGRRAVPRCRCPARAARGDLPLPTALALARRCVGGGRRRAGGPRYYGSPAEAGGH